MFSKVLLILCLTSVAFATIYVTAPVASTVGSGGQPASITWQDSGSAPSLQQFGPAEISIYAGNAQQQTSLQLLNPSVDVSAVSFISFTPKPSIGPNSNHYFIRFQSLSLKDSTGAPSLAFSSQFTLNNMTGTFSAAVLAQIAGQSTAPLASQTSPSTAGSTSSLSITTPIALQNPTTTASTAPSPTQEASGALVGMEGGWVSVAFGVLLGLTMF